MIPNFVKAFYEDMKYYDPFHKELNAILKSVDLTDKIVLDVGAGTGRLAFSLSKYAKKIVALDKDKRFKRWYLRHKTKNLEFINNSLETYSNKNIKFDVILFAWSTINFKLTRIIKRFMTPQSLFVFTTCDSNSEYETIIDKLGVFNKTHFDSDVKNKLKFINQLPKEFKLIKKKIINTTFAYPNKKTAFRIIKNSLMLWFNIKFDGELNNNLRNLILKNRRAGKIIFKEKVWFYLLKLR